MKAPLVGLRGERPMSILTKNRIHAGRSIHESVHAFDVDPYTPIQASVHIYTWPWMAIYPRWHTLLYCAAKWCRRNHRAVPCDQLRKHRYYCYSNTTNTACDRQHAARWKGTRRIERDRWAPVGRMSRCYALGCWVVGICSSPNLYSGPASRYYTRVPSSISMCYCDAPAWAYRPVMLEKTPFESSPECRCLGRRREAKWARMELLKHD